MVHTEFRDGNVPAGHEQLRVLRESLEYLPSGIDQVLMRSDTAGYQQELLRYCAEGRDQRFGVIGFAVGVDVTSEFKKTVAQVGEGDWRELRREVDGHRVNTGQQYAEVRFVPNWIGHSKNSPPFHRHQGAAAEPAAAGTGQSVEPLGSRHGDGGGRLVQGLWSGDQPGH